MVGSGGKFSSSSFDALKEYESRTYLTKLLIKAKSQMKAFIAIEAPIHAKSESAPIKTLERCFIHHAIKDSPDYRNAKCLHSAAIADYVL